MPGAPPIPLRDPVEDQPPPAVLFEEPHIPTSTAPSTTDPLPPSSAPSVPLFPTDSVGPSTSASPLETIPISPHAFLVIMIAIRSFVATSTSFTTAYATLAERMACTEAVVTQNNAILIQIQSSLDLPHIPPPAPT